MWSCCRCGGNRGGVCGGFDVGCFGDCGVRGTVSGGNRGCGDCVSAGPTPVGDASSSSLKLALLLRSSRVNRVWCSELISVFVRPTCTTVGGAVE